MNPETAVTISNLATNPNYGTAVLITAIAFLGIGFAAGFFLSRPAWEYFRWLREFKRTCKREDEEYAAAKKEAEANRKTIKEGYYWDRSGRIFCPVCQTPLGPFRAEDRTRGRFVSWCPKCKAVRYIDRAPDDVIAEVKAEFVN